MTKEKLEEAIKIRNAIDLVERFIRNIETSNPSIYGVNLCDEARDAILGIYKGKLAALKHDFENL